MAQQFRERLAAIGIRERLVLLVLAMLLPWIAIFATTYASYERDLERDEWSAVRLRLDPSQGRPGERGSETHLQHVVERADAEAADAKDVGHESRPL